MMNIHKHRASLLVSALVIFTFLTTIVLVIFTYANTNLNHAKRQEEGIHAYYLAYSGAEMAYEALKKEAEGLPGKDFTEKWMALADGFYSSADANFLARHKVSVSFEGKRSFPGYQSREFSMKEKGATSKDLSHLLSDFRDAMVLIEVTRLPEKSLPSGEEQYPGFLRIESTGIKAQETGFEGRATKLLYIDPANHNKIYWK